MPFLEDLFGLVTKKWYDGFCALLERKFQLFVNKVVGKINTMGIMACVGIENLTYMSPVDGSQTHGARLAGGVYDTIRKIEGAKLAASLADAVHLGMCRRVDVGDNAVGSGGYYLTVTRYDRPKRASAPCYALVRQAYRLTHQFHISWSYVSFGFHLNSSFLQSKNR